MSAQSRTLARQLQRFHRTGHTNTAEITDEDLRYARLIAPNPDVVEYELEDSYPIQWLQRRNFNAFLIGWQSRYTSFRDRPQRITARPRFSAQQPQTFAQTSTQISAQTHAPVQQTPGSRARELLASPFRRPRIGYIDFGSGTRRRSNSDSTPQRLLTEGSSQTPAPGVESPTYGPGSPTLSISFQFEPRGHESTDESSSFVEDPSPETSEPEQGRNRNEMNTGNGTNGGLNPGGNPNPNPNPNPRPMTIEEATNLLLTGFREQRNQVADVVAAAFREQGNRGGTPAGDGGQSRLKSDEVGYFNPTARDTDGTGITSSGKVTVFTDVYAFTNRLRHLGETRGEQAVKEVWTTCLQSTALNWHSTELTNLERTALAGGNLELVCSELERHFKRNPSEALQALQARKFTLLEVMQGKTLRPFIQSVVKDAKACGLPEATQVVWAFEACDSQIQAIVGKPLPTTSLGQFLVEVDRQESVIQARAREMYPLYGQPPPPQPVTAYGYAQQQGRYPQTQYPQPYNQFNPNARGGYGFRGRARGNFANQQWRNQYNNWDQQNRYPSNNQYRGGYNSQNHGYGNQNFGQRNQGQNQNQIPPQQQWNSNQNRPDNRPGPGNQNRDPRFYQQNRGQFRRQGQAYHAAEHEEGDDFPPPDFSDQSWQGEYRPETDQYEFPDNPGAYEQTQEPGAHQGDPGYDQPPPTDYEAAHFATASTSDVQHECRHCNESFRSRNILFRHLSSEHGTPVRMKDKKAADATETALAADYQRLNISSLLAPPERQGLIAVTAPTQSGPTGTGEPTRRKSVTFSDHLPIITDDPPAAEQNPFGTRTSVAHPSTITLGPSPRSMTPPPTTREPATRPPGTESTTPIVIKSKVDSRPDMGSGYGFRTWTYLKYFVTPDPNSGTQEDACGDTGCSKSLADRQWVAKHYPQLQIRQRAQPLTVRGIGDDFHQTADYVVMPLYFKGTKDGKPAYAFFEREIALVSGLQANMLIGMDILGPEQFDILNSKGITVVGSCGVTISMESGRRGRQQRSVVKASEHTVVPPRAYHKLAVEHNIQRDGQDFLFDPAPWNKFAAYALLADANMSRIIVRNDTEKPLVIPRGENVGHLESIDPLSSCMHIDTDNGRASGAEEYATSRPPPQQKDKVVPDSNLLLANAKTVKHRSGITIHDDANDPNSV